MKIVKDQNKVEIKNNTSTFTSQQQAVGERDSFIASGLTTNKIDIEMLCDETWVKIDELSAAFPETGISATARIRFKRSSGTESVTICSYKGSRK